MKINGLPEVVAHRGASAYAPENTLSAFELAIAMGVDGIELDVQQSRDGEIVVIHDASLERTTNGNGSVGEHTLAELRSLDAGAWFLGPLRHDRPPDLGKEIIPTLSEVLNLLQPNPVNLCVEIKNPELYGEDFEAKVLDDIRRQGMQKRVQLFSFNPRSIVKVKELTSELRTALLSDDRFQFPVEKAVETGADTIGMLYTQLTREFVESAHRNNLSVTAWTVDDEPAMLAMRDIGVDCLISNYPDRALRCVGK